MKWFAVALVAVFGIYALQISQAKKTPVDAVELLRSESLRQLVTERIVTQVVVQDDFGDLVLGADNVFAFGTVSLLVGVDLKKMVVVKGLNDAPFLFITLPKAEVISTELDEDSVFFVRKASALQRLRDIDGTEQHKQIRVRLKESAHQFLMDKGLMPSRNELEKRVLEMLTDAGLSTDSVLFVGRTN